MLKGGRKAALCAVLAVTFCDRKMLASHAELVEKLGQLEQKYDSQFRVVFDAIRQMMQPEDEEKRPIGFTIKEDQRAYAMARASENHERGSETTCFRLF